MPSATRPIVDLSRSIIKSYTVKAASTCTVYFPVKFNSADETQILDCAAADQADGVALETGVAGAQVQIVLYAGGGIAAMKVGAAGCTVGKFVAFDTLGVVDATTVGGGTVMQHIVGRAMQTGVSGDIVGIDLSGRFDSVHALAA